MGGPEVCGLCFHVQLSSTSKYRTLRLSDETTPASRNDPLRQQLEMIVSRFMTLGIDGRFAMVRPAFRYRLAVRLIQIDDFTASRPGSRN